MTNRKRKKDKIKLLTLSLILMFNSSTFLLANESNCKKFDLKCKTREFIDNTKNYQKKGIEDSSKQLNKSKKEILEIIPKKR